MKHALDIEELWDPKFPIYQRQRVVTFGSCFAQHFGKALAKNQFSWYNCELGPPFLSPALNLKYNYGVFSSRTGNIYTASLLRQWTKWALGKVESPNEVWEKNGRFYDPFRPNIEPEGFASVAELHASRDYTIRCFGDCIRKTAIFVFTLGLTESWMNSKHGYEYPMCPGTVAGEFDKDAHVFKNQDYEYIRDALQETISLMKTENPRLRFLFTVSPVPLTATYSPKHVLVATMGSKSILRAVADKIVESHIFADYFPSYEIINSPAFKGMFFEPNLRSVSPHGVEFVMKSFFGNLVRKFGNQVIAKKNIPSPKKVEKTADEIVCEEEILAAFANTKGNKEK